MYSNSATLQRNLNEHKISATVSRKLDATEIVSAGGPIRRFTLSWNHYQILCHIKDNNARSFYEIEAFKQQWSVRQLQRQIGSSLYERLALSRDKDEVMRLAKEGQKVEKPADILKDPVVLEFVNDALVELTLPQDANIYAQQYALCLPDKALLQQKLREWIEEYRELNEKEGDLF